jgi:hypothetical protein
MTVCYVCEIGGYEWNEIRKVTTDKKEALRWKRNISRVVNKAEAMREKWRKHYAKNRDYNEVFNYTAKHGMKFDVSYAGIEEHNLE